MCECVCVCVCVCVCALFLSVFDVIVLHDGMALSLLLFVMCCMDKQNNMTTTTTHHLSPPPSTTTASITTTKTSSNVTSYSSHCPGPRTSRPTRQCACMDVFVFCIPRWKLVLARCRHDSRAHSLAVPTACLGISQTRSNHRRRQTAVGDTVIVSLLVSPTGCRRGCFAS